MDLNEARDVYQNNVDGESTLTLDAIYERIRQAAKDGEKEIQLNVTNYASTTQISERQVEVLRSKGYTVNYNRPCLWYEISGWAE